MRRTLSANALPKIPITMGNRQVVVDVCDRCGRAAPLAVVSTHRLALDGHTVEFEACERCWSDTLGTLAWIGKAGRKVPRPYRKVAPIADAVPWPGTPWVFTSHALIRLGERKLSPLDVIGAAENPEHTYPGEIPESEVRVRGRIKAVVSTERHIIITAANKDTEE